MDEHQKQKTRHILWFGLALDIILFDQISKWVITEWVIRPRIFSQDGLNIIEWFLNTPEKLPFAKIEITSFFNLVMAWNTGVSFSMFSGYGGYMPFMLICVALGITVFFVTWLIKENRPLFCLCYALIIGGAVGNVIDRIRFGAVIDFLDFHIYEYHWPAFNVADMAVVIGIGLLIILSFLFDLDHKDGYRV